RKASVLTDAWIAKHKAIGTARRLSQLYKNPPQSWIEPDGPYATHDVILCTTRLNRLCSVATIMHVQTDAGGRHVSAASPADNGCNRSHDDRARIPCHRQRASWRHAVQGKLQLGQARRPQDR